MSKNEPSHLTVTELEQYEAQLAQIEEHLSKLEEIAKKLVRCMDRENYDRRDVCVIADTAIGQIDEIN